MRFLLLLSALLLTAQADLLPSAVWRGESRILLIGERHSAKAPSEALLRDLDGLRLAGMTVLAMELPSRKQRALDQFAQSGKDLNWLSDALWGAPTSKLPEGYALKLAMIDWARQAGVRVAAIDADRNLFHRLGTVAEIARQGGLQPFFDADGADEVASRGLVPHLAHLTAQEALREFYRLWLAGRSEQMARNLAKVAKSHEGRIVALTGALHVSMDGFPLNYPPDVIDLSTTPRDGVRDYLPAALKASTQTLLLLGGDNRMTDLDDPSLLGRLHSVERALVRQGHARSEVAIRQVSGVRGVDSALFFPL